MRRRTSSTSNVVPADDSEAYEMIALRDRLRADPGLRDAYAAEKRRIVGTGVTDSLDYTEAKTGFIVGVLKEMGAGV